MKLQDNIFDWMLTGLFALLVFGMMGNGAQPVRLAILGLLPFMLLDVFRRPHESMAYYRYEVFFLAFWWMWAASFLYKAVVLEESVKHLIYLFIHIFGFLEVIWAANKAKNPQRAICRGWIIMLILSLPIAVWEFTTGQHLPTTIMRDQSIVFGKVRIDRPYAAVTFGNLNSYNTAICWALPYLFIWALFPEKKRDTLVAILTFIPLFLIVILNSSRGAILCMGALIMVYVGCYLKIGKHRTALLSALIVATFVLAYYLYEMFFFIIGRFADQGMGDDGRVENIVQGTRAWLDSWCLGIGIGNYEPIMDQIYRVDIPAPHNLFLEILVVFGLFIAVGFMGMLLRIFLRAKRSERRNRFFFAFAIVALFLGGMVDSGYWQKATTWFFIAAFCILSDARYNLSDQPHNLAQR